MATTRTRIEVACRVEATVNTLFRSWPELRGFSVQDVPALSRSAETCELEGDLCLTDLTVYPAPDMYFRELFWGEIAHALLELIDERPEARHLLRGRTFVRALN